jgi:hypothetical protein
LPDQQTIVVDQDKIPPLGSGRKWAENGHFPLAPPAATLLGQRIQAMRQL